MNIAIWKLPRDYFIGTCQRRLKEGTVGVTLKCDEHIVDEYAAYSMMDGCYQIRFDRFGILKCILDWKSPAVVHVSMLNSIISNDESF